MREKAPTSGVRPEPTLATQRSMIAQSLVGTHGLPRRLPAAATKGTASATAHPAITHRRMLEPFTAGSSECSKADLPPPTGGGSIADFPQAEAVGGRDGTRHRPIARVQD